MTITASVVKELREKTGAGMMDCKRALTQTEGEIDAAVALLREKGLAGAARKAGRVAAEGSVGVFQAGDSGVVVVELNCETDFVAKNPQFLEILAQVGKALVSSGLDEGDGESAKDVKVEDGTRIEDLISNTIASLGEKISLRRFSRLKAQHGIVSSYVHGGGKIGVALCLEGATPNNAELGRDLAMQVAAANPRVVSREQVSEDDIRAEKEIFKNQALASGKPEKILDKIVTGKIDKYFSEICLVEQEFVKDSSFTVGKLIDNASKEAGHNIGLASFVRYQLGAGIEKKKTDLAREVAEQIAQGN